MARRIKPLRTDRKVVEGAGTKHYYPSGPKRPGLLLPARMKRSRKRL